MLPYNDALEVSDSYKVWRIGSLGSASGSSDFLSQILRPVSGRK
jgi:hypothetical protein